MMDVDTPPVEVEHNPSLLKYQGHVVTVKDEHHEIQI